MNATTFSPNAWIDKLGKALSPLEYSLDPFLNEYWKQNPRTHVVSEGPSGISPDSLLDDLRDMYSMAYDNSEIGEPFRPLIEILNLIRYALMSHPAIERAVGQIVGRDDFWVQVPDSGGRTSLTDLIAGLTTRATRLSGDRFHKVACELNLLLMQDTNAEPLELPTEINHGIHAVLFWGLDLTEPVCIETGMAILPFKELVAFLDKKQVEKLAPPGSLFHNFRSIGAVVQPFRWNTQLSKANHPRQSAAQNPNLFFNSAIMFIDVLSLAHSTPAIPIAAFANCINRSASLLLSRKHGSSGYSNIRSAQGFREVELCPALTPDALSRARAALSGKGRRQFGSFASVLAKLSESLATQGRFAAKSRFVPLAIALEQMCDIRKDGSSRKLQNRVSAYLGTDPESCERLKESVRRFYDERSASVHNR